jgi:predicted TIM-barrel fold metal-dependent hydrolase
MRWIDTHVHIFSDNDNGPILLASNSQNTAEAYLSSMNKNAPEALVVVDFSMAETSDHVINSLDALKKKGIKACGVIKGNLSDERTRIWIKRDDVKGIRLYAKDSVPDVSGEKWQEIFRILKNDNKHLLMFGSSKNVAELIESIPNGISILVDHLGMPNIFGDGKDTDFARLLEVSRRRGDVYFKGPGYRTSLDIAKVKPVIGKIIATLGADKLILGASDGPFAGAVLEPSPEYAGKKFDEVMDYKKVFAFINDLAKSVANGMYTDKLLYGNAKKLYGF